MRIHSLLLGLVVALAVGACGGGSSSSTSSSTGSSTSTSGTGSSTSSSSSGSSSSTTSTGTTTAVISGVAAIGAPLMGATVRAVDANGASVNMINAQGATVSSGQTSTADGSYKLTLVTPATGVLAVPLLIEAAGVDGSGRPVVLHSTLQSATLPLVANITPLTDAVVGMVLGTSPQTVFASAPSVTSTIALLGSTTAVTTASTAIKTIITPVLTDAKVTTLNLFQDSTFVANKTGVDAVLEALQVQMVPATSGHYVVQISNKFLVPGTVEVTLDLATARSLLAAGNSSLTSAITSTLATATSGIKLNLPNLANLDGLGTALNALIAQGTATATTFQSTPMVTNETGQSGRSKAALAALLAGYASNNTQFGRFQVNGCVDDPIAATGCKRLSVSTLVLNGTGQPVQTFTDTAVYATATTPNWTLSGNGRQSDVRVMPVAQLALNADGSLPSGNLPSNGIQVLARSQDGANPPSQLLQSVSLQVPSGFSTLFSYCGELELCLDATGSTTPSATGELSDSLIQSLSPGWVGSVDGVTGAKYVATVTLSATSAESYNIYLPGNVPSSMPTAAFPVPDAALSAASLAAGFKLSWQTWATANPNQRVFHVRVIAHSSPLGISDYDVANPLATSLTLPAIASTGAYEVWLYATNSLGQNFYSKLTVPAGS